MLHQTQRQVGAGESGSDGNEPLKVGDPHSPLNRRISIVLLRENPMVP